MPWLLDVGVSQLIADALSEELASSIIADESAALVKSEEVVELANRWPTYRGRHIGTDEIRNWFEQVENPKDQRILFNLLTRTRVFSEALVRERLKVIPGFLRPTLPPFIIRKPSDRRRDICVTYVDGPGKSGANFASVFAEENRVDVECVIEHGVFKEGFERLISKWGRPSVVLIVDDIAGTGRSLSGNMTTFLTAHRTALEGIPIRIVSLVATATAQQGLETTLSKFEGLDVGFRICVVLADEACAFPKSASPWQSAEQEARARALCTNLGARIYKNSPFGYGGLGLLVVFPTTVPNNSLPILHSHSRTSSDREWKPLFSRE